MGTWRFAPHGNCRVLGLATCGKPSRYCGILYLFRANSPSATQFSDHLGWKVMACDHEDLLMMTLDKSSVLVCKVVLVLDPTLMIEPPIAEMKH